MQHATSAEAGGLKPAEILLPSPSFAVGADVAPPGEQQTSERYSINECRVIYLPRIQDHRGNLTFIEADRHVPFAFKRTYYLYDVPGGSERGGHAHKNLHQFIVAMSGSFDIVLDDGTRTQKFHLNRSYYGLYLCPMIWRSLENFSSGSVCMVLASDYYDESDYYRDYTEFHQAARAA